MTNATDATSGLTAEMLRSVLSYDPETGSFAWLMALRNAPAGKTAGIATSSGQIGIQVSGRAYLAHRLAWLHVHGQWPDGMVDHINGDCHDNRIANLRVVTASQNQWNRGVPRNNTSTFKGVSWRGRRQKWYAAISVNGVTRHIGSFNTAEEAAAAYAAASAELHGQHRRQV